MKIKKDGKVITLTESDVKKITNKVLSEQGWVDPDDDYDWEGHIRKQQAEKSKNENDSWRVISDLAKERNDVGALASAVEFILKDFKDELFRIKGRTY